MSLLGTQVYANPTTPLWIGVSGNQTLGGDLIVSGDLTVLGDTRVDGGDLIIATGNLILSDSTTPTGVITSAKTVNPVPVSPAPATAFSVDTNYPTVINGEYDVQITGSCISVAGVADAGDVLNLTLLIGNAVPSNITFQLYPSAPGANGRFAFRYRNVVDFSRTPTIFATAQVTLAGGSTATYSCTINRMDVTRLA